MSGAQRWMRKGAQVLAGMFAGLMMLTAGASPALAGADLIVESIVVVGGDTFRATIRNQGDSGTGIFVNIDVSFAIDGVPCDTGIIIAGLGAGNTADEDSTACFPDAPGTYAVTVVVDSTSEVSEDNEGNNTLTENIVVAGPDLIVEDIAIAGNDTIRATLRNVGGADVNLPLNEFTNVHFFVDGATTPCTDDVIFDLSVGESEDTDAGGSCWPDTPGPHEVRVVVDADGDVAEEDETNNERIETLIIPGPDLVFTGLTLSPANPEPGEGKLTATVLNQGAVGTGAFVNINITMYLDGVECDTGLILAGLGAGSTTTEDSTNCNPSTTGPHTIRFEVDTDQDVVESDETNNSIEMTFIWGDVCNEQEVCDGVDNDCDGLIDEGYEAVGTACDGPGDDDLCKGGVWTCGLDKKSIVCSGDTTNAVELCNGLDDDCDGFPDDGFALGEPCNDGCGTLGCTADGTSVQCYDDPTLVEVCDGLDNDCDGQIDEDFSDLGDACTFVAVDGCESDGARVCTLSGAGTVCANQATDDDERCDGVDNDCDGLVDEPFLDEDLGEACQAGVGACAVAGTWVCTASEDGVECDAEAGIPADEDVCDNGVDDDCDGTVDQGCACPEGETQTCDGIGCEWGGTQACVNEAWATCECNPEPSPETGPEIGPEAGEDTSGGEPGADVNAVLPGDPEGCACRSGDGSRGSLPSAFWLSAVLLWLLTRVRRHRALEGATRP